MQCVAMTEKIGLKDGRLSVTILWTLAKPYIITGLEPEGFKSLYWSLRFSVLFLKVLIASVILFFIWIRLFKFKFNLPLTDSFNYVILISKKTCSGIKFDLRQVSSQEFGQCPCMMGKQSVWDYFE